jgi:hypothetical protein
MCAVPSPDAVLPALMNEYRVPEINVQNGVLKSLSFLFEYIGFVTCPRRLITVLFVGMMS